MGRLDVKMAVENAKRETEGCLKYKYNWEGEAACGAHGARGGKEAKCCAEGNNSTKKNLKKNIQILKIGAVRMTMGLAR